MAERTPLLPKTAQETRPGLSSLACWSALVKTFTGAGVLALPYAVSRCGIALGVLGFCLLAGICRVSCRMLLASKHAAASIQGSSSNAFAEIGREAYGRAGEGAVLFAIVAGLWGALVSFHLVVASSLNAAFPQLSVRAWLGPTAALILLLMLSGSKRLVAFASSAGNAVLFFSCCAVLAAGYSDLRGGGGEAPELAIPAGMGVFFGVATFSFTVQLNSHLTECLSAHFDVPNPWDVLPPQDRRLPDGGRDRGARPLPPVRLARRPGPARRARPTGPGGARGPGRAGRVLDGAIAAVLAFYSLFSAAAYACFGARTQQIVVLNIAGHGPAALAVQLSMAAVVALSWPVVALPLVLTLHSLGAAPGPDGPPGPAAGRAQLAIRAAVVLSTAACATLFTASFALFTSLVGSFAISLLTTILPPLFYRRLCGPAAGPLRSFLALAMALVGALVAAASAALVIADLAHPRPR